MRNGEERVPSEMQGSVERVGRGMESARAAGDSIIEIQNGSVRVGQSIDDIAIALREQGKAMPGIAQDVERIAQMTEANNAEAGRTVSSARQLALMADTLRPDAGRFPG